MAEGKKGFILYADMIHTVKKMPKEKIADLFCTILEYVNDENPEVDDLIVSLVFEPIKQQLKRDLAGYEKKKEKKAEAGRIGGLKRVENLKQNQVMLEVLKQENSGEANQAVIVNVNDNVNVNVIKKGTNVPKGLPSFVDSTIREEWNKSDFLNLPIHEAKSFLRDFIEKNKPDFIEPYAYLWNLFASENGLSEMRHLTDARKKKLKSRIREPMFDFIKILMAIKSSQMLKGGGSTGWKVDFDWIVESESNYVKILEGKYN